MIKSLNVTKVKTIISVEHNLDAAISNSTLIYHLANGKGHFCSPQKYAAEYLKLKGRWKQMLSYSLCATRSLCPCL